jgi:acid phosphatase (class A)
MSPREENPRSSRSSRSSRPSRQVVGALTLLVLLPALAALPAACGRQHAFGSQVNIVELLPPPPDEHSPAQQADLAAVLEAQRAARADGSIAHAVADVQMSCARFSDALGYDLTSAGTAQVLAFLDSTARQGAVISVPAKRYWRRTRPFAYSTEVEPLGDMPPRPQTHSGATGDGAMTPAQLRAFDDLVHSSYPSGHTTFGTLCAILLADMVPEKREALFARNFDYDHSRMVVGAHFPTDLDAGRIAGTVAASLLLQDPGVRSELGQARASLRATLGLPGVYIESRAAPGTTPGPRAP